MSESERSAYAARVFMPPIRLKLTRLSRGTYRWEIEVKATLLSRFWIPSLSWTTSLGGECARVNEILEAIED